MKPQTPEDRRHLIVSVVLLAVIGVCLLVLGITGRLGQWWIGLVEIFKGRDEIRVFVESWGAWAPAAFIAVQALQVVFAPIPGELTGAVGGYVFGAVPNILYSTLGLGIGSTIAFLASRVIGLPLVKLVVSDHLMEKFHFLTERKGTVVALVCFIIPGFPKDIFSYLLGLSPMGFFTFLFVCTVGRIPGTIMLSYSGHAAYNGDWLVVASMSAICAVAIGFFFWKRDRIQAWLKHKGEPHTDVKSVAATRDAAESGLS